MNITKEQTGELTATLKVEVKESDYNADYQQELKICTSVGYTWL